MKTLANAKNQVTKTAILNAPIPEETNTYKPVPNRMLITDLQKAVRNNGGKIENEWFLAAKQNNVMYGNFRIKHPDYNDPDFRMAIGFQNSYDKSTKLKIALGAEVLVCSNGMFLSTGTQVEFIKKHQGTIREDLATQIQVIMKAMSDEFQRLVERKVKMQEVTVEPLVQAELLGRMYIEEDIVTTQQLSLIKDHMKGSTNFKGNTLWDFYNNLTEGLKRANPFEYLTRQHDASSFIENEFKLVV